MILRRLARLRGGMKRQGLDGLLVALPASRRYLSGYLPGDGQPGESSGMLLIAQRGAALITDFRYELSARQQAPLFRAVIHQKGMAPELAALAAEWGVKRLGFEAEALLVAQHEHIAKALAGVELVPADGLVAGMREIKDQSEIKAMRRSLGLMEQVLDQVMHGDLIGRSERELALVLARGVEDAGGEGMAFEPIVASGPNAAEPHAEPGPRVIEEGDVVLFDVGARLEGYCSDISRTVVAGGPERADGRFAEVYALVRRAQNAAIAGIRPGMTGAEADAIAREVIAGAGHGERFGHSLGHGVGLLTHEAPSVSPRSKDVLEPGMVFTIEPGVYLPGWGGVRLEQMVELTDDGCRLLNRLDGFYDLAP